MTYESPFKPHGHDGPHHDLRFTPDPATAATQAGATLITPALREKITDVTGDPRAIEDWTAEHLPPVDLMAAFIEGIAGDYDTWDTIPAAMALTHEDDTIAARMVYALAGDIDPDRYPEVLRTVISESMADRLAATPHAAPIIGYALQLEAHSVHADELTAEEIEIARTQGVAALPQAQELCILVAADCAGRVWWGTKNRGTGEVRTGDPLTPNMSLAHLGNLMRAFSEVLPLHYLFADRTRQLLADGQAEDGDRG